MDDFEIINRVIISTKYFKKLKTFEVIKIKLKKKNPEVVNFFTTSVKKIK